MKYSTQCLEIFEMHQIPVEVKDNGMHLQVMGITGFINFWPATGVWIYKDITQCSNHLPGFGIYTLLRHCREDLDK